MATTNSTKQYLVNYDSTILYPYTTLDCVLGSDDPGSKTGADAIISKLLDPRTSLYTFDPEGRTTNEMFIHPSDVDNNLFFLGMYSKDDKNAFVKLESIVTSRTGGDSDYKDYFLSKDGTAYKIGIDAPQSIEMSDNNTGVGTKWIKGEVAFHPNECSIKLNFTLDNRYFEVSNTGALEIKNAKEVEFASKIKDPDSGTTIGSIKGLTTPAGQYVYVKDGHITPARTPIGKPKIPIYYAGDEGFKPLSDDVGSANQFVYLNKGEITECKSPIGSDKNPIYIDAGGKIKQMSTAIGTNIKPIFFNGESGFAECKNIDLALLPAPAFTIPVPDSSEGDSSTGWATAVGAILTYEISAKAGEETLGTAAWKEKLDPKLIAPVAQAANTGDTDYDEQFVLTSYKKTSSETSVAVWERLKNSVGIEEANNPDNVYYITGVKLNNGQEYDAPPADSSSDLFTAKNKEYTDVDKSIVNKLGYATDTWKKDGQCTGIYFKGLKLYQTSDERLKTFTQEFKDIDLDELSTIKKGLFYWNTDENKKLDIGVTAQSVERLFPEIVDENNGVKSVSYSKLAVVALAAVDKLNDEIKLLKQEIAEIKKNK